MKAIINAKILLEDSILWDGVLLFEKDRIINVGRRENMELPLEADIIDAGGMYLAPGFVDIHNHGSDKDLFFEDIGACVNHFLSHGETTVLPTFYCNLTLEQMVNGAEALKKSSMSGYGRIIAGLYMEGPYMGGFGSNQKSILWNGKISREEYLPLLEKVSDFARVWAIDPAREGIDSFMQDVKIFNPNAVFTMGHSHATAEQCRKAKKYGLRLQTHHGDSGKAPGRAQGMIGSGCDEYALYDPDIYTEMICDQNGIHLDPYMMKMVIRTKGIERVILITDSMPDRNHYKNNEEEGIWYGPDLNYDYEGHLAGSHLTMDSACRNLMAHTGIGLCQAVRMASLNPARLLGIEDEVGSIEAGKKANLLIMDDMVRIRGIFFEGEEVLLHT